MPICVDKLRSVQPNSNWPWDKACHLFDDKNDIAALHDFAKLLGLKHEWFQDRRKFPHYDLSENKRRIAITKGAKEVDKPNRG